MCEYISDIEQVKMILNETNTAIILYFTASWCGPCKMISPYVDELKKHYSEYNFFKIDVDEAEDVSEVFEIQSMPTFIIVKDKQIINRFSGANKQLLIESIENIKSFESTQHSESNPMESNQNLVQHENTVFNDNYQNNNYQDINNNNPDTNLSSGLGMDTLDGDNYYYINN